MSVAGSSTQATTTVKNVLGLTKQITDASTNSTIYSYDSFGSLLSVTDPSGNVSQYSYDIRGRKQFACEPDRVAAGGMGCNASTGAGYSWSFTYDPFGELLTQMDADSTVTNFNYDALGRPLNKTQTANGNTLAYSDWEYDMAAHGIGKIDRERTCTDSICGTITSERDFTYDDHGQQSTVAIAANGTSQGTFTTGYDSDQHISSITCPSGFQANYTYTSLGFLTQLFEVGNSNPYWTLNSRDAQGHVTSEQTTNRANGAVAVVTTRNYIDPQTSLPTDSGLPVNITANGMAGNPPGLSWTPTVTPCTSNCWGSANWGLGAPIVNLTYTYDLLGKVTERVNSIANTTEYLCYDNLNRLTGYSAPDSACKFGVRVETSARCC